MKNIFYLLTVLLWVSCADQENNRMAGEEGNSGNWKAKTGYTNVRIKSITENLDSIFLFDKNKILREEGIAKDTTKLGWWVFYDSEGTLIKKSQFYTTEDKAFLNQEIKFLNSGKIDTVNSEFYLLKIKDTLKQGVNKGVIELYTFNNPYLDRYSHIIIENEYNNSETKLDTFSAYNQRIIDFGIYAKEAGPMIVNGIIYEEILGKEKNRGNDSVEVKIYKIQKFFQKEVFVESH